MTIEAFTLTIVVMVFTDNVVLTQGLGICPAITYAKGAKKSLIFGIIVTFAMVLTSSMIYPIEKYILFEYKIEYLETMIFVPILFIVGFVISKLIKVISKNMYEELGCVGHLITTNCAIFGIVLLNVKTRNDYLETVIISFTAGIGFTLAMMLFSSTRSKIESAPFIPESFKGTPIILFAMAILSLIFMSFAGIAVGLLGN